MLSSSACWARYGEVLAREFGDPAYSALHQLTVDAYAVQHPGVAERRAIQSVGLHLMILCLILEDGADPREDPKLHRRMVRRPSFEWLDPPLTQGRMTVADVLPVRNPSEHEAVGARLGPRRVVCVGAPSRHRAPLGPSEPRLSGLTASEVAAAGGARLSC